MTVQYYVDYADFASCSPSELIMTIFTPPYSHTRSDITRIGLHASIYPNSEQIFENHGTHSVNNFYFDPNRVSRRIAKTNVIIRDKKTGRFVSYKQLMEECSEQFNFMNNIANTPADF